MAIVLINQQTKSYTFSAILVSPILPPSDRGGCTIPKSANLRKACKLNVPSFGYLLAPKVQPIKKVLYQKKCNPDACPNRNRAKVPRDCFGRYNDLILEIVPEDQIIGVRVRGMEGTERAPSPSWQT
jgi:hypothetical protein